MTQINVLPQSISFLFLLQLILLSIWNSQTGFFFSQFLIPFRNNSAAALLNILPLSGTFKLVLLLNVPVQVEQSGQPSTHCII